MITRHNSTHIPQAVGLLLPISDVKEIENAKISLVDEDEQQLGEDDHPLLIVLFLIEEVQHRQLKDCYIRLFGKNASKAPRVTLRARLRADLA